MRILLVEDNELSRELFTDVLEGDGHDVAAACDGISGRELGLARVFDLILLDLHLPGTPGDQVCRDLRAHGVSAPIVAISASAMPEEIARAMPAGFTAYLTKPITPSGLREAIRRYAPSAAAIG